MPQYYVQNSHPAIIEPDEFDAVQCSAIDAELEEFRREIEVVTELSKKAIYENARVAVYGPVLDT